jgi:hypothetical protein
MEDAIGLFGRRIDPGGASVPGATLGTRPATCTHPSIADSERDKRENDYHGGHLQHLEKTQRRGAALRAISSTASGSPRVRTERPRTWPESALSSPSTFFILTWSYGSNPPSDKTLNDDHGTRYRPIPQPSQRARCRLSCLRAHPGRPPRPHHDRARLGPSHRARPIGPEVWDSHEGTMVGGG